MSGNAFVRCTCAAALKSNWATLSRSSVKIRLKSSVIADVILHLSSSNSSTAWLFFKWLRTLPGYSHSLQTNWVMLRLLVQHRKLAAGRNLLYEVARKEFLSSPSVLNSLLLSQRHVSDAQILSWLVVFCAQSDHCSPQEALRIFSLMGERGLVPDAHACCSVLHSLVKSGLTATAWKIFDEMRQRGFFLNRHVFNVMIYACCKSGELHRAKGLVSEMKAKGISPDLFSYNTLISLYSKKGMRYQVLELQTAMEEQGISPDRVTYNSLLHGLCRDGQVREARGLFREMGKTLEPNHVSFTTLIDGCCRSGDLAEAFSLLEEMEARGITGAAAYNAIIRKLCELGKIRAANSLLTEMDSKRVEADSVTCNTLINAYCKKGDMDFALKLRDKMVESGLVPDQFTFKALIHGFCRSKQLDHAKDVLYEMLDAGFSPNYATFSWVIDGLCNRGEEEAVLRIPQELLEREFPAGKSLYRAMVRRFCKRRMVGMAERAFSLMEERGFHGDGLVCATLAFAYMESGRIADAEMLIGHMARINIMITWKIYTSMMASHGSSSGDAVELLLRSAKEKRVLSRKVSSLVDRSTANSKEQKGTQRL